MPVDDRTRELLARYPDQLDDVELAELRAVAETDPEVEDLMNAVIDAEAALMGLDGEPGLSEIGRKRLDSAVEEAVGWSTGGATPSGSKAGAEEVKGWSTGGATPSGKVTDLGAERRRRGLFARSPAASALAAGLLVATGFMLSDQFTPDPPGRDDDDFGIKGDDDCADPDLIEGQLWVMGEVRVEDGDVRFADAPVTFQAVLDEPAALILLETQAGKTFVIHPEPGQAWIGAAGSNLLQPEGASAEYSPGAPGQALYTLLASGPDAPIPVPPWRRVDSAEELIEAQEATYVLDRVTIVWEEKQE